MAFLEAVYKTQCTKAILILTLHCKTDREAILENDKIYNKLWYSFRATFATISDSCGERRSTSVFCSSKASWKRSHFDALYKKSSNGILASSHTYSKVIRSRNHNTKLCIFSNLWMHFLGWHWPTALGYMLLLCELVKFRFTSFWVKICTFWLEPTTVDGLYRELIPKY